MPFTFRGRSIEKVAVIGSGQIGPDIALHFTKVLAPHGAPVVVVDIAEEALAAGRSRAEKKVGKGVESGAFETRQAAEMLANLEFTSDYEATRGADFVVEAATEDIPIKRKIMTSLVDLCSPDAVLTSNSSHLEPEVIFEPLADRSRTLVVHYFFPAERNPMLEIIPGADTDPGVAAWARAFYEEIGKFPIVVGSRYGYAIDPIFEGLMHASCLLVEEGAGTTKEVDAAAKKTFRMGVGPFTAHNLTGGNPITHHGLGNMHGKIMPWFRTTDLLDEAVKQGTVWDVPARGEKVELDPDREARIRDDLTGAVLGIAMEVIDSGIVDPGDLEMGVETALVMTPPLALSNRLGVRNALDLVRAYAAKHEGFVVAKVLEAQAAKGEPFEVPVVLREDRDGVAVITIRRPKTLNALNDEVYRQLEAHLAAVEADADVVGAVVTGYGRKAFVSGADVGFLARIESPEQAAATSASSQASVGVIGKMKKPVVCALNGMAFGGGVELALACDDRVIRKGAMLGTPEVTLGLIPGSGATQRLPRLVGFEAAARMLRTGRPIGSAEAVAMGLAREEVDGDVVEAAAELARMVAAGNAEPTRIPTEPVDAPEILPDVELGHLSTAVDSILVRAILEGAKLDLDAGLALEAKLFGEVSRTEDFRIGVDNFMKSGPRAKAPFVNG